MPAAGNPIYLSLQLGDGAIDKFVRATVKDASGTLIDTVTLSHVATGRYENATVLMPETPVAYAVYEIFDDSALTTKATEYDEFVSEDFELIPESGATVETGIAIEGLVVTGETLEGIVAGGTGLDGIVVTEE